MKKCPFCKADIEDNARFCLYCMKRLNEKEAIPLLQRKKRWWILLTVVVLALITVLVMPKEESESTVDPTEAATLPTEATVLETQPTETAPSTNPDYTQKPTDVTVSPTVPPTPTVSPTTAPTNPLTEKPTDSAAAPTEPTVAPTEPTQEATTPDAPKIEAEYTYRAAQAGDDFSANYQNAGNDIVITGITQTAVDGVYDIPAYIDGKKVIAIVANAFSGSDAKVVYIPETVKTIWNDAFAGCDLTDIYFRGNAIYTESKAFSSGVTIHCSATCSDRNFRYYKNSAANYGATWVEWNG